MKTKILASLGLGLALALFWGPPLPAQDPEVDAEGYPIVTEEPDPSLLEPPAVEAVASASSTLTPVDPRLWTPESYPPVAGLSPAWWYRGPSLGYQKYNGQPTLLYSDFPALWTALEVQVLIFDGDDDYYGLAVGFQPGDTSNPSAEYLLVDWKRLTYWFNFGAPSCTPGSDAYEGLAVSRVFGVPAADEFWGHVNFNAACSDLDNGVAELARASTLGDTGWPVLTWVHFRLEYTPARLKVFVDGQPEIELAGDFAQGRWAFYNFSQARTFYAYPTREFLPPPAAIDIKPGSDPNAINISGHGVIPVAILGSEDFKVRWVDITTLFLAGLEVNLRGRGSLQCAFEDASGPEGVPDSFEDLVCQFADDPAQWNPGDGMATLEGSLLPEYGGVSFSASDYIIIVP